MCVHSLSNCNAREQYINISIQLIGRQNCVIHLFIRHGWKRWSTRVRRSCPHLRGNKKSSIEMKEWIYAVMPFCKRKYGFFFVWPVNGSSRTPHTHNQWLQSVFWCPYHISTVEIPKIIRFKLIKIRSQQQYKCNYHKLYSQNLSCIKVI